MVCYQNDGVCLVLTSLYHYDLLINLAFISALALLKYKLSI